MQCGEETNIRDPRSYEHYWTSSWNKTWIGIAKVMGSNPVRVWIFFFFLVLFQLLAKNKSGENLSFFNISSNDLLRSRWIAAIRRDEGPDFEVRVASWPVSCQMHVLLAIDFPFDWRLSPLFFSYKIFINFISITLNPINESTILFTLGFSIYFWLKLSNAHGYVLFVFINSDLVICYKWDPPSFILVIICAFNEFAR